MHNSHISFAHIAAMSENHCIGRDNDLPWHISADLKRFKALTTGGVMVLGRKTYDSFGAKPLPNRSHWVVTRQPALSTQTLSTQALSAQASDQVHVAHSLQQALDCAAGEAAAKDLATVWIIGGAEVFASTIDLVTRLELTHVHAHVEGDAYYPDIPKSFDIVHSSKHYDKNSGLQFSFVSYTKACDI